jgi:ribosomal protein L37AE/L43A
MKIQAIKSRDRRDFMAIYECQFCGRTHSGSGYDDAYFHQNVIPDWKCEACGKSTNSEGGEKPTPMTPKYGEHEIV